MFMDVAAVRGMAGDAAGAACTLSPCLLQDLERLAGWAEAA